MISQSCVPGSAFSTAIRGDGVGATVAAGAGAPTGEGMCGAPGVGTGDGVLQPASQIDSIAIGRILPAFIGCLLRTSHGAATWRPQRDSNSCCSLERAASWASRRWGQETL